MEAWLKYKYVLLIIKYGYMDAINLADSSSKFRFYMQLHLISKARQLSTIVRNPKLSSHSWTFQLEFEWNACYKLSLLIVMIDGVCYFFLGMWQIITWWNTKGFNCFVAGLTHCGQVTHYVDIAIGQYWLMWWVVPDGTKRLPEPMLPSCGRFY